MKDFIKKPKKQEQTEKQEQEMPKAPPADTTPPATQLVTLDDIETPPPADDFPPDVDEELPPDDDYLDEEPIHAPKRDLYNKYKIMAGVAVVTSIAAIGGYFAIQAMNKPPAPAIAAVKATVVPKVKEIVKAMEKPEQPKSLKAELLTVCDRQDLSVLSHKLGMQPSDINDDMRIESAVRYVRATPHIIETATLSATCHEFLRPVPAPVASEPAPVVPTPAPDPVVAPVIPTPTPVAPAPAPKMTKKTPAPAKKQEYDKKTIRELNDFFKN